jgi:hypothetical protein
MDLLLVLGLVYMFYKDHILSCIGLVHYCLDEFGIQTLRINYVDYDKIKLISSSGGYNSKIRSGIFYKSFEFSPCKGFRSSLYLN